MVWIEHCQTNFSSANIQTNQSRWINRVDNRGYAIYYFQKCIFVFILRGSLRVISGEARGRRLAQFKGQKIRPASDKVRGAIFNILGSTFEGSEVLDLFAGTGALGIEALSRGAKRVVFIENSPAALRVLQENLELCRCGEKAELVMAPVERGLKLLVKKGERFDHIFLDPPYGKGLVEKSLKMLSGGEILKEDGIVTLKHSDRELPLERYGSLILSDQREYGRQHVSFFTPVKGITWKK
jgi:16S rRNA (guanine(966)-N(2))-methyltransferase RsmD